MLGIVLGIVLGLVLGLDIESTGIDRFNDVITWVGVSLYEKIGAEPKHVYTYDFSKPKRIHAFEAMVSRLIANKIKCIWQNGKFEHKVNDTKNNNLEIIFKWNGGGVS